MFKRVFNGLFRYLAKRIIKQERRLNKEDIEPFLTNVLAELSTARALYAPMATRHHGLAVIQEEFEEFKREVFYENPSKGRDRTRQIKRELTQMCAMCIRFYRDLLDKEKTK